MKNHQRARFAISTALAVVLAAGAARGQQTFEWATPVSGIVEDPASWTPAGVPGELDTAVLGGVGPYSALVTASFRSMGSVRFDNDQAVLAIRSGTIGQTSGVSGPGLILVNDDSSISTASFAPLDGVVIETDIRLNTPPGESLFRAGIANPLGGGASPAIISGTISGRGSLRRSLDITGTIDTSAPGDRIEFLSTLRFGPDASVLCDVGGGIVLSRQASGGFWQGGSGGELGGTGGGRLTDVRLAGTWLLEPEADIELGGTIEAPSGATLVLQPAVAPRRTELTLLSGASVEADMVLEGATGPVAVLAERFAAEPPSVLGTISGSGLIAGSVNLLGGIDATEPGSAIFLSGDDGFGRELTLGPGAAITAQAGAGIQLGGVSVTGGSWDGGDGATLTSSGGDIRDTSMTGTWVLEPGFLDLEGTITGDATLMVAAAPGFATSSLNLGQDADLFAYVELSTPPGEPIEVAQFRGPFPSGTANMHGEISGTGQLRRTMQVFGGIEPGGAEDVDRIDLGFDADIAMGSDATIGIDVAAADAFDQITGDGAITLDGAMRVRFIDGFEPAGADVYAVISNAAIAGEFASIDVGPSGAFGPAHVVYGPDAVIVVACAADRDADGELTLFDFLAFQNQFAISDVQADLDGDGSLTLFDFLAFQNKFSLGCD